MKTLINQLIANTNQRLTALKDPVSSTHTKAGLQSTYKAFIVEDVGYCLTNGLRS